MARQRTEPSPIRYRYSAEVRALTASAPPAQQRKIEAFRLHATDRKLLLLECAIIRRAPFSDDGRTIWELLPTFDWFTHLRASAPTQALDGHSAIDTSERAADNQATP